MTSRIVVGSFKKDKYSIEIILELLSSIIYATSSKFIIWINKAIKKRVMNIYLIFEENKYIDILFFIKFIKVKY